MKVLKVVKKVKKSDIGESATDLVIKAADSLEKILKEFDQKPIKYLNQAQRAHIDGVDDFEFKEISSFLTQAEIVRKQIAQFLKRMVTK